MIVLTLLPAAVAQGDGPRVLAHYDGDITKAHLHPAKREELLARYAA